MFNELGYGLAAKKEPLQISFKSTGGRAVVEVVVVEGTVEMGTVTVEETVVGSVNVTVVGSVNDTVEGSVNVIVEGSVNVTVELSVVTVEVVDSPISQVSGFPGTHIFSEASKTLSG